MTQKHRLTGTQTALGRKSSALLRGQQKQLFLWDVRDHLIAIEKDRALAAKRREGANPLNAGGTIAAKGLHGPTLRERADLLNARGVRTVKGLRLDEQKLSAALIDLGVDANTIKKLKRRAEKYADVFGVQDEEMVDQLWHEWLYHHTRVFLEHGVVGISKHHPFDFQPIPPGEWNKNRPEKRDIRVYKWWYRKDPILPPQAKLVFALFGMFGYVKVGVRSGKMRRQLVP